MAAGARIHHYRTYQPLYLIAPRALTLKQARESFAHFMDTRQERLAEFGRLLDVFDVEGGSDDAAVARIAAWYVEVVQPSDSEPGRMEDVWYWVAHDFGVLIGEMLIRDYPVLKWELVRMKSHMFRHRPVVCGFPRGPHFELECAWIVSSTGEGGLARGDRDPGRINKVVQTARSYA